MSNALARALRSWRRQFDAAALIRTMVFNRLCAPDSKLGVLRWPDTVAMPDAHSAIRHDHRRVVLIADRGLLGLDNLAQIEALKTAKGEPLEYILAVPGRRYGEFVDLIAATPLTVWAKRSGSNAGS